MRFPLDRDVLPKSLADVNLTGKRIGGFVQNHDLFPTILSSLSEDGPEVDGLDLTPLITGEQANLRDFIITGWSTNAAVRSHDWAYSCNFMDAEPNAWLFNVKDDPGELTEVAAQQADVVNEMRGRLEEFLGEKLPATCCPRVTNAPNPASILSRSENGQRRLREAGLLNPE